LPKFTSTTLSLLVDCCVPYCLLLLFLFVTLCSISWISTAMGALQPSGIFPIWLVPLRVGSSRSDFHPSPYLPFCWRLRTLSGVGVSGLGPPLRRAPPRRASTYSWLGAYPTQSLHANLPRQLLLPTTSPTLRYTISTRCRRR